jgi:hypothetical protein
MTPPEPNESPPGDVSPGRPAAAAAQPVTTLRGASVDVDIRRVGRVVALVCVVILAVTGAVLLVAGIHTNQQITTLHRQGVPVSITVTGCTGLIGGTGAQSAGYACNGTYLVHGTRYHQAIPGMAFHAVGSTFPGVAVPGDPKLLSTPDQVASQHASWRAYLVPGVLLVVAVAWGGALYGHRRSRRSDAQGTGAGAPR